MIKKILQAKHWQIFLITLGLPLILNVATSSSFELFQKLLPPIMVLFVFGFFGWFWAISIGLQKKIPTKIKMNVLKFKIFFFIPSIYILFFVVLVGFASFNKSINLQDCLAKWIGIILPLHFFSMFCILYCLYFTAKTFKTVELQKGIIFSDFAGEFFLFLFYPIGIWMLQPKINKMIKLK